MNSFDPDKYPDLAQLLVAFCLGILFSPWSLGLLYFLIFLIIYEAYAFYATAGRAPSWKIEIRLGVMAASIFGFIIGRILTGWNHPLDDDHRIHKTRNRRPKYRP